MKHTDRQCLLRPQLNSLLERTLQLPLTVIRASMGFGKTTAIREYLRLRRINAIYLPLLGAGGTLGYCWERLTTRVMKLDRELGEQMRGLGFPENGAQAAKMMELLTDAVFPEPQYVVIDDYHLIDCQQAADFLALLTGERIPGLHLILLARETPYLPVDDLRQKGLCGLISQENLEFQPHEVTAYFEMLDAKIPEEKAYDVTQWTGGWISGIYLIARGVQHGVSGEWEGSIDQLLEMNLYSTYDEKTRRFLEMLSFLDAFTPEQTAWVFDDQTAPKFLCSLIQGNAFISYNRSTRAYQMTDLLRDFLRRKARQSGYDPGELYRRMGQWLLEHGQRVPAFAYWHRAGDMDSILKTMNREDAPDIKSMQFGQINLIFQDLPRDVFFQYPLAALQYIRVRALTSQRTESASLDQLLSQMEQFFLEKEHDELYRSRVLGEIHNTWILVAFNDALAMVEHASKAVAYFAGRYSCLISSETEFTFGAVGLLYAYYNRAGRLRELTRYLSQNLHILGEAVKGCGWGSESLILAEYALETGDFETVSLHAYKAIYQARLYRQIDIEICATFVLCRLALYEGRGAETDRLLSQLGAMVEQEHNRILNTTVALCAAYVDCCSGRVEKIPRWLRENEDENGAFLYSDMGFHHVVTGMAALQAKEYVRLEIFCDVFERDWHAYQNQMGMMIGGICRAGAGMALYGEEAGARALAGALDIAVQDGVIFPFAEQAGTVLPLLPQVRRTQRYPEAFLDRMEACCRRYEAARGSNEHPVRLSDREQEILRYLSEGKRHQEIAAQMYISVPTVRYHILNIYRKLGVNNKMAALAQVRERKLPL